MSEHKHRDIRFPSPRNPRHAYFTGLVVGFLCGLVVGFAFL